MSSSPDLSPQSGQPPTESTPLEETTISAESDQVQSSNPSSEMKADEESSEAPVLRKPPMRPVRPSTPPQPPASAKTTASGSSQVKAEVGTKPEIVSVSSTPSPATIATTDVPSEPDQDLLRQQPIPPPSEPKQYRAIGLVRGLYVPSEEEFTRGEMKASDGTTLKAVLLGRVMSLVKNHVDLQKEHLWVVYPRTREEEKELHLQIVGLWEPETLKKDELDNDVTSDLDSSYADSGLEDGYFSIRGEIVFNSPEDKLIVVKIQQTPRKNSQKAKAFKLSLQSQLENPKAVGYFWDLHVKRQDNVLEVTDATCIGLAPPKKRSKDAEAKSFNRRPPFNRNRESFAGKPRPGVAPRTPRDSSAKPIIKRTEQPSSSED